MEPNFLRSETAVTALPLVLVNGSETSEAHHGLPRSACSTCSSSNAREIYCVLQRDDYEPTTFSLQRRYMSSRGRGAFHGDGERDQCIQWSSLAIGDPSRPSSSWALSQLGVWGDWTGFNQASFLRSLAKAAHPALMSNLMISAWRLQIPMLYAVTTAARLGTIAGNDGGIHQGNRTT